MSMHFLCISSSHGLSAGILRHNCLVGAHCISNTIVAGTEDLSCVDSFEVSASDCATVFLELVYNLLGVYEGS